MNPSLNPESSAFSRALLRVLSQGRFTAAELADVAECSDRYIHMVASGEKDMAVSKAERICRYLSEHGERRCSDAFYSSRWVHMPREEATANGVVDDETNDLVKAAGRVSEAHARRDPETMETAIDDLYGVVARYRAEAGLLK